MSHAFWTNCLFSMTCLCLAAGACTADRSPMRLDGPGWRTSLHRAGLSRAPGEIVVVKTGDTLQAIAQRNHVSVRSIMITNDLVSTRIRPGQELYLPPFQ
ncbi:MAG: LysM peptidoglycan-binding domain-containing protein [Hyphomicrobiaceae bacterium]|nr:LysM peptidoglycan-binding domain-containing protein [Hyphomicrobiaceae bacterium]